MTLVLLFLGTSALVLLSAFWSVNAQATTYWLGTRDGYELRFNVKVPADAAAIILHKDKAPGRGDDTTPRYRTFTHTIDGKTLRFHANELGWENLQNGSLTWAVEAGSGAEWRNVNTKDPLWNDFAKALTSLATVDSDGWSSAKVVMAESMENDAPTARLNLDGSVGKPSEGQMAIQKLTEMNSKTSLFPDELNEVRGYMLAIANAGRANPNYRREAGSKVDLDLRSGLTPLVLKDILNDAAQNQAEYCAQAQKVTHEQDNAQFRKDPRYATFGTRAQAFGIKNPAEAAGAGSLQDYPTGWMKSDTHYRPWWDLQGVTTGVGFGVAKGSDGMWYSVAVFTVE